MITMIRAWIIRRQIRALYDRHAQLAYELSHTLPKELAAIGNKIAELKKELK